MTLAPYTNTYTDVDSNIIDSDDLVNEFWRVSDFINALADSYRSTNITNFHEKYVEITDSIIDIAPSDGIIQVLYIEADVETIAVNFTERADGETYRVYLTLRSKNRNLVFTVSGPGGETHMFGLNRTEYTPGQTVADGHYTASVMATYGKDNGVMINVFAHNAETTTVDANDILSVVPL